MITKNDLNEYLAALRDAHPLPFFVERFFRTEEEWDRLSPFEIRGVPLSARTEVSLARLLQRGAVMLVGEPGSGKSTLAVATLHRSIETGLVPIFASLRSYSGDLAALLRSAAPAELAEIRAIDGPEIERVLILDGLDEIPQSLTIPFISEVEAVVVGGAFKHVVLTSRQAFYAQSRRYFKDPPPAFYLLGFADRDIRMFIGHRGGDYDAFMAEIGRVGLGSEISNPFTLDVLFTTFSEVGTLGASRSAAVDHVVESLVASRPRAAADRQRRALRMLATAMETACRNELTWPEAIQLLRTATPLNEASAEALLTELTLSILVRTTDGIAFQMRSYGEYLAALELSTLSLDRIYSLINHAGTAIPNESWRNCATYLAELHAGFRAAFSIREPDWVISVSPTVFQEGERTTVVKRLISKLAQDQRYVRRHPFLRADRVAHFVTPEAEAVLRAELDSDDPVRKANAFAILGACRRPDVVARALPIALDGAQSEWLRESAISAVAGAGDSTLIPRLLESLKRDDPFYLSLVDCIGALTDALSIPEVLPLLLETDAMVSSAFYRFRTLRSVDSIEAFLKVLVDQPLLIQHNRLDAYAEPLWEALRELWKPEWAEKVAALILAWEDAKICDREAEDVVSGLADLPDHGEKVAALLLTALLDRKQKLIYFSEPVGRLVTPALAAWLAEQPSAEELMHAAARFGSREVRDVLAPHLHGFVQAQEEAIVEQRQRQEDRTTRDEARRGEQVHVIRTESEFGVVLNALFKAGVKDWPEVDSPRKEWLAQRAGEWLQKIDPLKSVKWLTDNQLSYNPALPLIVQMVDHYGVKLENDVPIVQSLLAVDGAPVAGYYRRHGLSAPAVAELERIVADRATPSGALYHYLQFLNGAALSTVAIGSALIRIAEDYSRPDHIRSWAIHLMSAKGVPNGDLETLAQHLDGARQEQVLQVLIERGHRPTVERRVAALLADDTAMRAGDVSQVTGESPLSWISKIASTKYWNRLEQLRARSLQLELPHLAGMITGTMHAIDGVRLAAVIRDQLPITPAQWREVQRLRADEYERDGRLRQAQATPFERVVQKLRAATSLAMFKIWCEGLTDAPTIEMLLSKSPDAAGLNIVADSLGGWRNILSPSWRPDRLRDGCHDVIVLLDGDKGRTFATPDHPLNPDAQRVRQVLEGAGIELFVLERYAIENYFSSAACQAVIGPRAARAFPLPAYQPARLPNHSKNQNPEIARHMTLDDIAGTDLLEVLRTVIERSRV